MQSKYKVFFESLVITLLILLAGFAIGFFIESYRTNKVIQDYKNFEVSALDLKLQNYYYETMDQTQCSVALQNNLNFADKIYNEGLLIEKYEQADDISNTNIINQKEQYVLLKTELWMNSIILKKKCSNPFHTVVYIYSQNPNSQKQSEQEAISNTLKKVKEDKGNSIILIPIAGDMGLDSVDMQLKTFKITYLPSIIIDENTTLQGYHNVEQIERLLG